MNGLLALIVWGMTIAINVVKYVALCYCIIKIILIGFGLIKDKDSPKAIQNAKEQGKAAVIGIMIVVSSFAIASFIERLGDDISTQANTTTAPGQISTNSVNVNDSDTPWNTVH